MVRTTLAVLAFFAAATVTLVNPPDASAQVVRVYRGGYRGYRGYRAFRRPYRVWRMGMGWVWIYPPPVVVAPPAPLPPPPPPPAVEVSIDQPPPPPSCGECSCNCCCNQQAMPEPQPSPYPEPLPGPVAPPAPMEPPAVAPPPPQYDFVPPPRPHHHSDLEFGLGLSGTGFNWDQNGAKTEEGGAVVHLRLRPSGHVTWEFALGGMGGKDELGIERHDVPATAALMLYPWASTFAPYFVAAGGGNFVTQDYMGLHREDSQVLGALGGGLELRLGHHFTVGFDVRHEWRWQADKNPPATTGTASGGAMPATTDANGTVQSPAVTLVPVGDESGTAYNLSATYYF